MQIQEKLPKPWFCSDENYCSGASMATRKYIDLKTLTADEPLPEKKKQETYRKFLTEKLIILYEGHAILTEPSFTEILALELSDL